MLSGWHRGRECISVPWDSFPGTCSDTRWHGVEPSRGLVPVGLAVGEMGTTEGSAAELLLCGQNILTSCPDPAWELVSTPPTDPFVDVLNEYFRVTIQTEDIYCILPILNPKPNKGSTESFWEAVLPFPGFGESCCMFLSRFVGFCWDCGWDWERASTDKASDSASPTCRKSPLLCTTELPACHCRIQNREVVGSQLLHIRMKHSVISMWASVPHVMPRVAWRFTFGW